MNKSVAGLPPIRSFVRRGRITSRQRSGWKAYFEQFAIEIDPAGGLGQIDYEKIFDRQARRTLEIGFGDGDSLLQQALASPDQDFIGIEVHRPGIGHLLCELADHHVKNVRVICHDAVEIIERAIEPASIDVLQIFFPDPWPKKRHHKRRLIKPLIVRLLVSCLKPGGMIHLATDWEPYAEQMLAVLEAEPALENVASGFIERPSSRPPTKFERRGIARNHLVRDIQFRRKGAEGDGLSLAPNARATRPG